jgi:hypothetical protein
MRAGILIVGSLFWDNSSREAWRKSHLLIDRAVLVKVPIYYGRRSGEKRGHTFTMTLAADGDQGQAFAVPCAKELHNVEDLVVEAQSLWRAEMEPSRPRTPQCLSATWGCVGARFRDAHSDWISAWAAKFQDTRPTIIEPVVDVRGLLCISWPEAVSGDVELDVLLATATRPEKTRPSPKDVADAWANQESGHEKYFLRNVEHGIQTPDDAAIWKHLNEKRPRPRWLTHHQTAVDAYFRYRHRLDRGEPGTPLEDWLEAERAAGER